MVACNQRIRCEGGRNPRKGDESLRLRICSSVVAARATFGPGTRRYAGIVLDVVFDHALALDWGAFSAEPLAAFVTDPTPNNYPRLPIREDARVLLMLGRLRDAGHGMSERCQQALRETLPAKTTVSRLAPTARSALPA